ncbi:MAG: manganese efflux pump [Clostridia bacterium]|nr:manganese efflux pump [Clostridia bacterium]
MELWELFLVALGLAMDAGAVSICKGLSVDKIKSSHQLKVGVYFGGFQALMPLIGYLLGVQFQSLIERVDHWIAFVLLALIGINMIREAMGEEEKIDSSFTVKAMLPLAVATSIDALAVGITFAFLKVEILPAICFIGAVTFVVSVLGLMIGNVFGCKYRTKAEVFGGIVLIFIGLKILTEHLGIF